MNECKYFVLNKFEPVTLQNGRKKVTKKYTGARLTKTGKNSTSWFVILNTNLPQNAKDIVPLYLQMQEQGKSKSWC